MLKALILKLMFLVDFTNYFVNTRMGNCELFFISLKFPYSISSSPPYNFKVQAAILFRPQRTRRISFSLPGN